MKYMDKYLEKSLPDSLKVIMHKSQEELLHDFVDESFKKFLDTSVREFLIHRTAKAIPEQIW